MVGLVECNIMGFVCIGVCSCCDFFNLGILDDKGFVGFWEGV